MAAQDYNPISQPSLGVEGNSLRLVVNKDQKKQRRELAQLATVLKAVEREVATAKSGASKDAGPSNTSIEDTLAKMAGALQILQIEIAKYADKKASSETTISKAERDIAQQNLEKANKALKKLQKDLKKQKTWGFWEKFGEAMAGVVLVFVAAALEQPELLIAAALVFAGAAGLTSKGSNELAKGFAAIPGISSELAKIIAGISVTFLMVVLTWGTASVAGVSTGAAAVAEDATEAGADGAAASENTSRFAELLKDMKKLNVFRIFSARTNLVLMAGMQTAAQTKVVTEIASILAPLMAKAAGDKKNAKQIKKEAEMAAGIIVAVMSLIVSAGSATALAEGANAATTAEETTQEVEANPSVLRRLFQGAKMLGVSSTGQRLMLAFNTLSQFETAGTGGARSAYEIKQGLGEIDLTKAHANTTLNNVAIGMNNSTMQNSQEFIAQREKEFKTSDRAVINVMKGEEAFAQLLSTSMV